MYIQERLGEKQDKYLVLRQNRIDRIVIVLHAACKPATSCESNSFVTRVNGPATPDLQEGYHYPLGFHQQTEPPLQQ